jgi:hypothetical protein
MKRYIWNVLISVDQLINTLLGGFPDETLSSRMGKRVIKKNCKMCKLICRFLDLFEKDHCYKSIEKDEGFPM